MTTITADISASQTTIPIDVEDDDAVGGYFTIDSEAMRVLGTSRTIPSGPRDRWSVDRAVGGTTAATHASGATLTRYYPDAATAEGGLSNPLLAPFTVNPSAITPSDEEYLFFIRAPEDYETGFGEIIQVQNFLGTTLFAFNVFGGLFLYGTVGSTLTLNSGTNANRIKLSTANESGDVHIDITGAGGKKIFRVLPGGATVIGAVAAPADADLAAGQVGIWFDATNGAAKLMVKGKSANGTVVTGELALT